MASPLSPVLLMSCVSYRLQHSKPGFEADSEECVFAEGVIGGL